MDALSDVIQREPGYYKPKYDPIYETPKDFDIFDVMGFTQGQPYDYFNKLREQAPVAWHDSPETVRDRVAGCWTLTRYEDIKYCDQNPKIFSSQEGGILLGYDAELKGPKRLSAATLNSLINLDQPYHIPLRMAHRPFFTPDYIAKLQKKVEKKVDQLLDKMEEQGPIVDMVPMFSEQLPMFTLCEMLGVDEKDRPKIIRWMHYLENAQYIVTNPDQNLSPLFVLKFIWNIRQMFRYGEKVLADRRKNPRDDLLTIIATTEVDGAPMTQQYLDGSWLLIIFAGNDTTRNSLSGTMKLLTQFPDQKDLIVKDLSLVEKMVPEALRLVSPVMYMRRVLKEDAELSGQKMAKGEKVSMWYAGANRDPDVFHDPERMDIFRNNASEHLAFGTGPHVCLGQRTAIMQLKTAYERILDRFPNIKWTGKAKYAPNSLVHAISHLEVDLGTK